MDENKKHSEKTLKPKNTKADKKPKKKTLKQKITAAKKETQYGIFKDSLIANNIHLAGVFIFIFYTASFMMTFSVLESDRQLNRIQTIESFMVINNIKLPELEYGEGAFELDVVLDRVELEYMDKLGGESSDDEEGFSRGGEGGDDGFVFIKWAYLLSSFAMAHLLTEVTLSRYVREMESHKYRKSKLA